jgi:hypothetical protein
VLPLSLCVRLHLRLGESILYRQTPFYPSPLFFITRQPTYPNISAHTHTHTKKQPQTPPLALVLALTLDTHLPTSPDIPRETGLRQCAHQRHTRRLRRSLACPPQTPGAGKDGHSASFCCRGSQGLGTRVRRWLRLRARARALEHGAVWKGEVRKRVGGWG